MWIWWIILFRFCKSVIGRFKQAERIVQNMLNTSDEDAVLWQSMRAVADALESHWVAQRDAAAAQPHTNLIEIPFIQLASTSSSSTASESSTSITKDEL